MKNTEYTPLVSVIIPMFNEERYIHDCLSSVLEQDWPAEKMEIIVVDNGSTDRSREIVKSLLEKDGRGRVVEKVGGTIASVRNFGWRLSKGQILAFLDADSVVEVNWLKEGCQILNADKNIACVGFAMAPPGKHDHWIKRVWYEIGNSSRHVGKGLCKVNWLCSFNIIVRSSSFTAVNGFDESLKTGEDYDLGARVGAIGSLVFSDSLFVKHLDTVGSIESFVRKEYWRGKSIVDVLKKYEHKEFISVIFPFSYLISLFLAFIYAVIGDYKLLLTMLCYLFIFPASMAIVKVGFKKTNYLLVVVFYFFYLVSRGAAAVKI